MTTLQEALDGAIKYINSYAFADWQPVVMALHEAKAALAQQGEQQQQVVKEVVVHADYRAMWQEVTRQNQQLCAALSAAPASQAQPVAQPLSEVEIDAIWANTLRTTTGPLPTVEFARAIEAAIREVK